MTPTPTFPATVTESGRLQFVETQRRALDQWLATLKGAMVVVTVKRHRATRSDQQNRYYWGVVVPLIAEHCGYTRDEMHEALKHKFLRLDAEPDAHGLVRVRSSASLNTKEFTDFIEEVVTWAGAEFGLNIPAPNEAAA